MKMDRYPAVLALCILLSPALLAQVPIPQWCRPLPRPEYKNIERVAISDSWFEVYKPAPGVFAIYEPHQAEETISYLVVGEKRALLFGKVESSPDSPGKVLYQVDGISFLMRAPDAH